LDIDRIFPYFIGFVFSAIAIAFVFRMIKFGGVKAAIFGAEIGRTVGEIGLADGVVSSTKLKIHVLRGAEEKAIGLEVVARSVASYHMAPFSLSLADARQLIRLLQSAVEARESWEVHQGRIAPHDRA
jgi:hypothetical protein